MNQYRPQLHDYVKWHHNGLVDEGWVYFVDDEYLTIETGVKCKDEDNIAHCPIHQKIHTLVVCHHWAWDELEYVKARSSHHDNMY